MDTSTTRQYRALLTHAKGRYMDAIDQLKNAADAHMPVDTLMRRVATVAEAERGLAVAEAMLEMVKDPTVQE